MKTSFSLPAFTSGFYNTFIYNKFDAYANRICAHKMGFKNREGVFAHAKKEFTNGNSTFLGVGECVRTEMVCF